MTWECWQFIWFQLRFIWGGGLVNRVTRHHGKFLNMWARVSCSRRTRRVCCNRELSLYTLYLMLISDAVQKCALFGFTWYGEWPELHPLHNASRNVYHHTTILNWTYLSLSPWVDRPWPLGTCAISLGLKLPWRNAKKAPIFTPLGHISFKALRDIYLYLPFTVDTV